MGALDRHRFGSADVSVDRWMFGRVGLRADEVIATSTLAVNDGGLPTSVSDNRMFF